MTTKPMPMIPRVEDILVAELERRIVESVPETAPGDGSEPETFVTTIESRTVTRNVQEQNGLTVFCWVAAEISVIFYSQKKRYDYSALMASFANNPMIKLNQNVCAKVEIEKSEAVEGPYLTSDAWLFKASYPVLEVEDGQTWQAPKIAGVTAGVPDIYPRAEWDRTNGPDGGGRFERRA